MFNVNFKTERYFILLLLYFLFKLQNIQFNAPQGFYYDATLSAHCIRVNFFILTTLHHMN